MIDQIVRSIVRQGSKTSILSAIALLTADQLSRLIEKLIKIKNGANKELVKFIDDILNEI